jgi:RNA polymerase sigma-70 factor (ECF subfamily)
MAAPDDEPGRSPPAGLIGLLRKRDPEAWNDLFLVEHPAIYRYALSRLGDPAEAEDATSHVFTEAWEHAEALEDQGLPARAWLFGIARNVVNSRRRRWLQRPPALTLEAFDQPTHDLSTSPEMLDLAGAITALDHAHSEVITLRFIHGLSLQETAVALGTSVDAIKGRQARALAQLRKRVEVPPEE